VIQVNEPPTATDDVATTNEDTPVDVDVLANDTDVDPNDPIHVSAVSQSAMNGLVTINGAGASVHYVPPPNFNGTDSFTYSVMDLYGAIDKGLVVVTVIPVNDAPVAYDLTTAVGSS